MTPPKDQAPGLVGKFESRYEKLGPNECWPWKGSSHRKDGRGTISVSGKNITAPRVAWFVHHGSWPPDDMFVCHSCDNPPCVNPAHLWLGTAKDNAVDAANKGRVNGQSVTHCPKGHALEGKNVSLVKGRQRRCNRCTLDYKNQRRARRRALGLPRD